VRRALRDVDRPPLVDRATTRTHDIEPGEFAAALGPVADLLRRGTAREPADRVASMADLARSLEILRAGLVGAQQRRQRVWVAGMAVACTAALAGPLMLALRSPVPPATLTPDALGVPVTSPDVSGIIADTPARPADTPAAPAGTPSANASPPATPPPSAATLPAEELSANAVAAGDVPIDPQPEVDASTPSSTERPVVALTEAVVAVRLATRAARLRARCDVPWLVLDLTIQRGRATLAAINGMPFTEQDPLHACVGAQLRGLDFPRTDKPAKFSLTIKLSPKDPQ
jgi:hypothetical protein